jgi:septal ring factor EnvC (AmiA/AmiB activator)
MRVFGLILLLLLLIASVAIAVRRSAKNRAKPLDAVTPQELGRLAQPYRGLLGQAVAVHQEVAAQARIAQPALQQEFTELAFRLEMLVKRALPRAQLGTQLASQLLQLKPTEAQYAATQSSAKKIEEELAVLNQTLNSLKGKVYQVISDSANLTQDTYLSKDLDDALLEVSALEEAFKEI